MSKCHELDIESIRMIDDAIKLLLQKLKKDTKIIKKFRESDSIISNYILSLTVKYNESRVVQTLLKTISSVKYAKVEIYIKLLMVTT